MKRFLAGLAVVGLAVFGFTPRADAVGYGACTIVGTISFSSQTPSTGTWTIGPATLDCQGIIGKRARITGRGPLRGSGTYTALAPGDGGCLRQSGTGKVEYVIPTASGTIKVNEAATHTLAGVGVHRHAELARHLPAAAALRRRLCDEAVEPGDLRRPR